jgi:hypothetical protein
MDLGPFVVHLCPSVFMSRYQETSVSFDVWYMRRLYRAMGPAWPDVTSSRIYYEDEDFEAPESLGVGEGKSESMGMRWIRAEWDVGSWRVDVSSMDERGQG